MVQCFADGRSLNLWSKRLNRDYREKTIEDSSILQKWVKSLGLYYLMSRLCLQYQNFDTLHSGRGLLYLQVDHVHI